MGWIIRELDRWITKISKRAFSSICGITHIFTVKNVPLLESVSKMLWHLKVWYPEASKILQCFNYLPNTSRFHFIEEGTEAARRRVVDPVGDQDDLSGAQSPQQWIALLRCLHAVRLNGEIMGPRISSVLAPMPAPPYIYRTSLSPATLGDFSFSIWKAEMTSFTSWAFWGDGVR